MYYVLLAAEYKIECFVIARNMDEADLTFPGETVENIQGGIAKSQRFSMKKHSKIGIR